MREIKTDSAPSSPNPLSQAIQAGDFVFISGQIPRMPSGEWVAGDFESEARRTLENVRAIVEAAGGTMENICRVNVYLRDVSLFEGFNAIYREYFKGNPLPARTTIGCSLARPDIRIEIDAVAWLGG